MSPISIIDERKLFDKDFKIYGDAENPLFLAKDVAQWIDYSKTGNGHYDVSRMLGTVDEDEKVTKVVRTPGGNQKAFFLTEDGLYEVLMKSRKPIAKVFKKKVKEILRSIRKHGAYMTPATLEEAILNPDFGIRLLTSLKEEREARKVLELQTAQQRQIIHELQPKATYYDLCLQNKTLLSVTKIAKDYGMSGNALNSLLHELGVQYKQGDVWLLYQKHADKGYTQSKTHVIDSERSAFHTYWTQSGRLFIYELLKQQKGILPIIEREQGLRLVSSDD